MRMILLSTALVASAVALPAMASSVINVTDGGSVAAFGQNTTYATGVVFTAPQSYLLGFSFNLWSDKALPYVARIYAWSGTNPVGAALYSSAVQQAPTTSTTVTFAMKTALSVGTQYIVYLTNDPDGISLGGSGYANFGTGTGPAFYRDAHNDPSDPLQPWTNSDFSGGLAFRADFESRDAVPEPATWALLLAGFGLTGHAMRRRTSAVLA